MEEDRILLSLTGKDGERGPQALTPVADALDLHQQFHF